MQHLLRVYWASSTALFQVVTQGSSGSIISICGLYSCQVRGGERSVWRTHICLHPEVTPVILTPDNEVWDLYPAFSMEMQQCFETYKMLPNRLSL